MFALRPAAARAPHIAAVPHLKDARPVLPTALGDRAADVWEPLLAIADLAGQSWPARARAAALALTGAVDDTDPKVDLLKDVQDILAESHIEMIASHELLDRLLKLDDRPWATWRGGKQPITARGLAKLLGPLEIHPGRHETATGKVRGYRADAFVDAVCSISTPASGPHTTPEMSDTGGAADYDDSPDFRL
jgi:putative DNA primase/helicase